MIDMHDMTTEAASLKQPDGAALSGMAGSIDKVIGDVKSVLDFVTKYGSYIPGAGSVLAPLEFLDKSLGIIKALLDHVGA